MIGLPDAIAAVMLISLIIYVILGGADFGGGVWDLFASGPRKDAQRQLIEKAIAPVWEANHVWLILVVVLLFTAFPPVYAAITTALHIPITLMLLGIIMRGAAFTFRHYDPKKDKTQKLWGRIFSVSSLVTPIFLGICLGALTEGELQFQDNIPAGGFFFPWIGLFPLSVGFFALALFSFLAATYLAVEAESIELKSDFRKRAIISLLIVGLLAAVNLVVTKTVSEPFAAKFTAAFWALPLKILTSLVAVTSLGALLLRHYKTARGLAVLQAIFIVSGWGFSQYPFLIVPDFTIHNSAAPQITLQLISAALGLGALVLFPSLYWMIKIFKRE